jgi:hypothetical protein
MQFVLEEALAVLSKTPSTLRSLLHGLPAEWIEHNEGAETWSPYVVIGHLVHGERADWIPRARIIREHGESRPFDPFDRFAQFQESEGKSIDELLSEFETLRALNLETLREWKLSSSELESKGQHPSLGSVTLSELLATWVAHDLDHIAQIARTMAKQYSSAVGPWKAYLSILSDRT